MLNKATLIGRLTRDPEVRTLSNGTPVASVTLAVDRTFKNQNGERETDFINCVLWRKTAEIAGRYLKKGDQCCIVGRIQTRTYDDKEGRRQYVTEVVAEEMHMLGSPRRDNTTDDASRNDASRAFGVPADGFADIEEEEVPF